MGKIKDICPITGLEMQWYGKYPVYDNGELCELEIYRQNQQDHRYKEQIRSINKNKTKSKNEDNKPY